MKKRAVDLTPAILKVLEGSSRPMAPIDISAEIAERKLAKLESEHYEQTYGMPNFTHSVRSLLAYLQRQGKVRKVARARYELIRSIETPILGWKLVLSLQKQLKNILADFQKNFTSV